MAAFPVYAGLTQAQSDVLVFEIASLIQRHSGEILLARLGAVLSPAGREILQAGQCKLKRFITAATQDFLLVQKDGVTKITFIGSQERLVVPADVPAGMDVSALVASENDSDLDRNAVLEEAAAVLADAPNQTLLISQLGVRLQPATRKWIQQHKFKMQHLLMTQPRFQMGGSHGQESVVLVKAVPEAQARFEKPRLSICLSEADTTASALSSPSSSVTATKVNYAAIVMDMLMYSNNLEQQLINCQPVCYEE